MNQILEETYFKDPEKWQKIASQQGGLEICDNDTGQSIGVLKPNSIHIDYYPGVIPKNFHWNYTEEEIQTALDGFVSKSENGESKTKYTANQATQDLIRQAIIISHKLAISFGSPSDALKDIEDYDNKLQNSPEMHITSDEWELQNTTISLLWKITQIVLGGKSNKKMKEYTVEEATQDLLNHAIHIVRRLNAQHYDVNLTDALAAYEKQITLSVEMNDKAYIRLLYAVFLLRRIIETEED